MQAADWHKWWPAIYGGKPSVFVGQHGAPACRRGYNLNAPGLPTALYIMRQDGFAYPAVVIDLYSHPFVSWSLQSRSCQMMSNFRLNSARYGFL
jgi:hypothetical protein